VETLGRNIPTPMGASTSTTPSPSRPHGSGLKYERGLLPLPPPPCPPHSGVFSFSGAWRHRTCTGSSRHRSRSRRRARCHSCTQGLDAGESAAQRCRDSQGGPRGERLGHPGRCLGRGRQRRNAQVRGCPQDLGKAATQRETALLSAAGKLRLRPMPTRTMRRKPSASCWPIASAIPPGPGTRYTLPCERQRMSGLCGLPQMHRVRLR
jgi:hypothetical protein